MHNMALIKITPTRNQSKKKQTEILDQYGVYGTSNCDLFFTLSIMNKLHHGTDHIVRGMCKANIQESWRAAHGSSPGWS